MKTQIIRLERHDDVISIRDRMTWAKTQRILLVWPDKGSIQLRRVDVILIQRHSQQLGAQLALVCRDPMIIQYARELGIPVFPKIQNAQNNIWKRIRIRKISLRRKTIQPSLRDQRPNLLNLGQSQDKPLFQRIAWFCVGIMAVLAILATIIPSAEIDISPMPREQTVSVSIVANPDIDEINLVGEVPARLLTTTVEAMDSVASSGEINIPDKTAQGAVTFSNLTMEPVKVPKGTVVTTVDGEKVRFTTLTDVTVPASSVDAATVTIQALSPGTVGNVSSGAIQAVEGSLGFAVLVTNPDKTSGGSDQKSPAPSGKDLSTLRKRLMSNLELAALGNLKQLLGSGDRIIPETLALKQIIEEKQETPLSQPADHLTVTIRAEYQVIVVSDETLEKLGVSILNTTLQEGFTPKINSFSMVDQSTPVYKDGYVRWEIVYRRELIAVLPTEHLAQQIAAKPVPQAITTLINEASLTKIPETKLSPSWWPWMPFMAFRITIIPEADPG